MLEILSIFSMIFNTFTTMERPLISIIMAVYNQEKYILEALNSTVEQTYQNWELIVIDDGSQDETRNIIEKYLDQHPQQKIRYFRQANGGVSSARNLGLQKMKGEYLCFLDGDDILPKRSLESRFEIFQLDSSLEFVDGAVSVRSENCNKEIEKHYMSFQGQPLKEIILINEDVFFSLTWMIKINPEKKYHFEENQTHGEDLLFFISIAESGNYSYTDEVILWYRQTPTSAMNDIHALTQFYAFYIRWVGEKFAGKVISQKEYKKLSLRIKRIAYKSHIKVGHFLKGLQWMLKKV